MTKKQPIMVALPPLTEDAFYLLSQAAMVASFDAQPEAWMVEVVDAPEGRKITGRIFVRERLQQQLNLIIKATKRETVDELRKKLGAVVMRLLKDQGEDIEKFLAAVEAESANSPDGVSAVTDRALLDEIKKWKEPV